MGMLTLDTLKKHSVGEVVLPELSKREGREQTLTFRWISDEDRIHFGPMPPPQRAGARIDWKAIATLPKEHQPAAIEQAAKVADARAWEWFHALPLELQERRRAQARDELYEVIAYASLEPKLTLEEARALGPDAPTAYLAILRASGLMAPAPETTSEKAEETGAAPDALREAA